MNNLILIPLSHDLKLQYLRFVDECGEDIKLSGFDYALPISTAKTFADDMRKINESRLGIGLPAGYVPESVFWLYNSGSDRILGAIMIRHRLTDALSFRGGHIAYYVHPDERGKGFATHMLSEGLSICREMGVSRVLITCAKDNLASAKTIRNNGGVLDSEDTDHGEVFERYWITL
jgi:predicted acetyltransferase